MGNGGIGKCEWENGGNQSSAKCTDQPMRSIASPLKVRRKLASKSHTLQHFPPAKKSAGKISKFSGETFLHVEGPDFF